MRSKFLGVIALIAVAALTATACSTDGQSPVDDGDAPESVIRIGMTTEAGSNYDPITNPNAFVAGYVSPVFDTLLVADGDTLGPGLVEEWDVEGERITLHLREGVTFHDGSPVDAEAVVANLERARDDERSVVRRDLETVQSATAVSTTEVELIVPSGSGAVLAALAGRAGMVGSPAAFVEEDYSIKPIGAGPWTVSDDSVVGQRMVYTAYDGYWNPDVQGVDRIEIQLVDAQTAPNALLGGQIDIGTVEARPDQIPTIEEAGFSLQTFPEVAYQHLMYMAKDGPLGDPRVRQAISLGIDRQSISDDVLQGACVPQAAVQALPGADGIEAPARDVDAAKALLAEAGFSDGVEFDVVVSSAGPGSTILQAIQGQLEAVGITININPLARAQLLSTYVEGGADAYWTVNTGDFDSAPLVAQLSTTMSPGGSDADLDQLAAEGADATDPAERAAIYTKWNERFAEGAFGVGLCNLTLPYMVREGVEGLQVKMPLHIDPRGLTMGE
ncbi:ABC transporter substrate-binding protein [Microbacterium soli]|uniref:ABC transporter substrate-binding protein n=1 Tax=Microbacterium soli TaxID=446075 RepID=A0ABP7MW31_9MICO